MVYFRCTSSGSGKGNTVIVTCAEQFAGVAITIAKIGKSYTKVCPLSAPYVVKFYGVEAGTYTVSATVSGQTYSTEVIVQDVSCVLNYGFTWKTWVDTASKLDSTDYASLSEVLADEEAVRELFTEHACVDYMAEATSSSADLETIIENDLCAKWINNSDYALDYLGANTAIKALMDEADKYGYGEWVLKEKIPTMTSATAPYGEVTTNGTYSTNYAYYAFDGNDSTGWLASPVNSSVLLSDWVAYEFVNAIRASKAIVKFNTTLSATNVHFKIQGSNDGTTWVDVSEVQTFSINNETKMVEVALNAATTYSKYRLLADSLHVDLQYDIKVLSLQILAYEPKGNVPVMTANNAPYGEVFVDGAQTLGNVFKAFDGNDSTGAENTNWNQSIGECSIGYSFANPIKCKRVRMYLGNYAPNSSSTFVIQGSNDKSTWTNISEVTSANNFRTSPNHVETTTEEYFLHLRVHFYQQPMTFNGKYDIGYCYALQFYGRELSVSVPTMTSNTAPFGEVIQHPDSFNKASFPAWKSFDGDNSTYSYTVDLNPTHSYIGYVFPNPVVIRFALLYTKSTNGRLKNYVVQYSDDGDTWVDISSTVTIERTGGTFPVAFANTTPHRYWRLYIENTYNADLNEVQFYGLDYSEKEFEVGTTKKWLYDHGVELETLNMKNTAYKRDSYIELNNLVSGTAGEAWTNSAIDLSNYDLMRIKIDNIYRKTSSSGVNKSDIRVTTSIGTAPTSKREFTDAELPNHEYLDISSIVQSQYCGVTTGSNSLTDSIVTFNELWLE